MNEKHLEFIQSTVSRMATNCFLIKGWCITLVAGLCAASVSQDSSRVYLLAYIPTVSFALLDSYYLWLERRYRELFNETARSQTTPAVFSMCTKKHKKIQGGYFGAFWSVTVAPYYLGLAATILLVGVGLN